MELRKESCKKLTIFDKSQSGNFAYSLPKDEPAFIQFQPNAQFTRKAALPIPEISELDLTRHFAELAKKNVGIDNLFYPLGSCTMKLNPRINEYCANLIPFVRAHPLAPDEAVQGNLELMYKLLKLLTEICGMTAGSLLPNAGAQGEFTGIQMISAYHSLKNDHKRNEILIPDDAHGTNPASGAMAGYTIISVRTDSMGHLDIVHLQELLSDKTAGLMMTNPNTLGLFNPQILKISQRVHAAGGLLFYDGANLNPILNLAKPGKMGFDVMHLNLHKTFSTPHGGGGPGSGVVLCNETLRPFLPVPSVEFYNQKYQTVWKKPYSIGQIASFHGNFSIYLRAYVYILLHGHSGLRRIAEQAVLNSNYLKTKLKPFFKIPYAQPCMHEFVMQTDIFLDKGIKAFDIAKRMLDYQVHPPTIYFPLIVKECFLIEPTESESKATLDRFVEIIEMIIKEIHEDPEIVKTAPHTMSVARLDEVRAVKYPILIDEKVVV